MTAQHAQLFAALDEVVARFVWLNGDKFLVKELRRLVADLKQEIVRLDQERGQ